MESAEKPQNTMTDYLHNSPTMCSMEIVLGNGTASSQSQVTEIIELASPDSPNVISVS